MSRSLPTHAMTMMKKSGFAAFGYREYRFFWLGAAFSNVGMWALIFGRLWLMHDLTDSTIMVGLVTTATLGPVLLFSMWGGVVADRVNRLRLVQATRGMFAVLALLTGVLIATNLIEPWQIIAISVGTGILIAIDIPSRSAMMPTLVPREHLASAVALYSIVFGAAWVIGPALFEPLVNLWGIEGVFFLVAGSYMLTVAALLLMSPHGHHPQGGPSTMVQGLIDGLRYMNGYPVIKSVIMLGLVVGVFGVSYQTLLPVFSDDILSGGIGTYSRLLLFAGVGGLAAILGVVVLGTRVSPTRFFIVSGLGFGLGILVLSGVRWFSAAALAIALIGASRVIFETMSTTLLQTLTADEFRGRVMSLQMLTWGAAALGGITMGAIAEAVSVPFAMSVGGLAIASATALVGLTTLRRMLVKTPESAASPVAFEQVRQPGYADPPD